VEGAISYLNYSYRLMHFPLGVFAVALGTVVLPQISEYAALKDIKKLVSTYDEALGLTMFLVIPSAVYLAGFGEDLVRLVYQRGAFGDEASVETGRALFHYAYGLVGFAGVRVIAPVYYAMGDSKRPMYYSVISVLINVVLNFPFIKFWGFAGLAAATSAAGLANFAMLGFFVRKKVPEISYRSVALRTAKIIFAAVAACLIMKYSGVDGLFEQINVWSKIGVVLLQLGGMSLIFLGLCFLFRVEDFNNIKDFLRYRRRSHES
jgi:putative peptidoglycan lipid II flippase